MQFGKLMRLNRTCVNGLIWWKKTPVRALTESGGLFKPKPLKTNCVFLFFIHSFFVFVFVCSSSISLSTVKATRPNSSLIHFLSVILLVCGSVFFISSLFTSSIEYSSVLVESGSGFRSYYFYLFACLVLSEISNITI